jgi:GLPGLI family protein
MKILNRLFLVGLFSLFAAQLFAVTTEGHIKYQLTYEGVTDEGRSIAAFMPEMTLELYFNGKITRIITDMGFLMKMTITNDLENDKVVMITESGSDCKAIVTTSEELEAFNAIEDSLAGETEPMELEYLSETKEIFGYTCKTARTTDPTSGAVVTYWYTEELNVGNLQGTALESTIPGLVMGFETETMGVKSLMEIVAFDEGEVDKENLSMTVPKSCTKLDNLKEFYQQ